MRLIKLISTKARRRLDYDCVVATSFGFRSIMISRFIEVKAFGLFWLKINRYVIYF